MAEPRRYPLGAQLDIEQILLEAQHRWLRPAEICEILRNYKKFNIAPEPPHMPQSGSLFLFDRKVLRYFRKDGHNWRKKKDGKTVKEAHERLKAGSVDVLHCYYAHGEENESFQRRSYWLLEEEQSNIVLVHYREVKGNRATFNRVKDVEAAIPNSQESEEFVPYSEVDSSISSKFNPYNYQLTSQNTDTTSLNSTQASEYEDAESAYNHQASSGFHSFLEKQPRVMEKMDNGLPVPYYPVHYSNDYQGKLDGIPGVDFVPLSQGNKDKNGGSAALTYDPQNIQSWKDILESSSAGTQSVPFQASFSSNHSDRMNFGLAQGNELLGQILTDGIGKKQDLEIYPQRQDQWQNSEGGYPYLSKWPMDQKLHPDLAYHLSAWINGESTNPVDLLNAGGPSNSYPAEQNKYNAQKDPRIQLAYPGVSDLKSEESNLIEERKADNPPLKQPLLDGLLREGLKKLDSFDRWMSKELGDVNESHIQSSSGTYWEAVETEDRGDDSSIAPQLETYMLGPSLSQDQLFSIIDFSPNWAYADSEIKVLITGKFLKSQKEVEECQWSCMFGEVEVPAEVIADGVLRCLTPLHKAGRIPFYVTCSNRLACSEVREFEYRVDNIQDVDVPDIYTNEIILRMRFGKLLSLESANGPSSVPSTPGEESHLSRKISSLLKEDNGWEDMLKLTSEDFFSVEEVKEQLLEKLLKEKLHMWLLQKIAEGGKGPNVLDEEGQGVLHFAAALGYHWAIPPTLAAGVNVNFRDVNGWTALHWAAFCGRERTVAFLISQGAAAGALTDPTPIYLSGQTPADLASSKGHKGIAGFLAESALSSHLWSLELKDGSEVGTGESSGLKAVLTVSERTATPVSDGDSMKDSLAAVCNAIQAADRIHQVFRVQSFQRKQIKEYGDEKFGLSEERALSLVALKKSRFGQHEAPAHAAAIRIQNKFRSWKGRKEFLTIREQIVKIQAHVRGHQVRKNYRKIIWSVGILEKIILRWRRKGSGLRGFKKEPPTQASSIVGTSSKEDDYDFLKEGRKQTEERLQKALARVKSMVQYPEARDQYRRLLNVVTEMQEAKAVDERVLDNTEETAYFDEDLIDIDALLDDDTFMPTAT